MSEKLEGLKNTVTINKVILEAIAGEINWLRAANIICSNPHSIKKIKDEIERNGYDYKRFSNEARMKKLDFYPRFLKMEDLRRFLQSAICMKVNEGELVFSKLYQIYTGAYGTIIDKNYAKWLLKEFGLEFVNEKKKTDVQKRINKYPANTNLENVFGNLEITRFLQTEERVNRAFNVECKCVLCGKISQKNYSKLIDGKGGGCRCSDLGKEERTKNKEEEFLRKKRYEYISNICNTLVITDIIRNFKGRLQVVYTCRKCGCIMERDFYSMKGGAKTKCINGCR